jgi:phage N-6-adenine-methyltransferase
MNADVLFSTGKNDWETPQDFFDRLNAEFCFTLDVCALPHNAKCDRYFTPEDDGLVQDWSGETVWCNPPYSDGKQNQWIKKCYEESQKLNTAVVALLPARTDTMRFHEYIYGKAEIRFIRGRLRFVGASASAPFPSMVVIWRNENERGQAN